MRRGTLLLVPVFCLAAALAHALVIVPDAAFLMKTSDATAEVTIIGARLHTYSIKGELGVCGRSYDIVVNEIVTGKIYRRRFLVGERVWSKNDTALRDPDRAGDDVAVGATYFVGLDADPSYRDPKSYTHDLPDIWRLPAFRACLKTLPRDQIGSMWRVYRGDGTYETPVKGRIYLRLPTSRSIDGSAVFGSFAAEHYVDKPDTSENPPHDMAVDYEAFKRLVRDPNYNVSGRPSRELP